MMLLRGVLLAMKHGAWEYIGANGDSAILTASSEIHACVGVWVKSAGTRPRAGREQGHDGRVTTRGEGEG